MEPRLTIDPGTLYLMKYFANNCITKKIMKKNYFQIFFLMSLYLILLKSNLCRIPALFTTPEISFCPL